MKYRRLLRFHGLKRPRIRQTWNKYNLYNLARLKIPNTSHLTFFQQKWKAKALSRGYHGEHIKEGKWERMFSRRLLSVVDMDPEYLAKYDGSEQAAGRGSGREGESVLNEGKPDPGLLRGIRPNMTPYMQMTYAPMERRLDIAVFRSLFASSARQARQFVVHGAVKVNGVKMVYPGYQLNPGDMFQVDIDRVLTATGRQRPNTKDKPKKGGAAAEEVEEGSEEQAEAEADADAVVEVTAKEPAEEAVTAETKAADAVEKDVEVSPEAAKEREFSRLKAIFNQAKEVLEGGKDDLSAKRKQEIRSLVKNVKGEMSRVRGSDKSVDESHSTVDNLMTLMSRLQLTTANAKKARIGGEDAEGAALESYHLDHQSLSSLRENRLVKDHDEFRDNPVNTSKPYLTPWRPRPFMAPFAFIPPYLEVNQNICAAVYLRHPVARKGSAEVPTPFPSDVSQLAFNWYLRRR